MQRLRRFFLPTSILIVGVVIGVWTLAPRSTERTSQRFGAVQVFESSHGLWIFLNVDRITWRNSIFASPNHVRVPSEAVMLFVRSDGSYREFDAPPSTDFSPNLTRILYSDNAIWSENNAEDRTLLIPHSAISSQSTLIHSRHPSRSHCDDTLTSSDYWKGVFTASASPVGLDVAIPDGSLRVWYSDDDDGQRIIATTRDGVEQILVTNIWNSN